MATISHEVTPDALPYYDQGYERPEVREMVNQLIDEETKRYRGSKKYLEHLPPVVLDKFLTPILKNEFDRINKRQPMDLLSMKRYELPLPSTVQKNDLTAWQEAVNNSFSQLEHQATRICNLELLSTYGSQSWRLHNDTIAEMVQEQQKKLLEIRKEIQQINWQRKSDQISAGRDLRSLEESWNGLVSKNYEIERACADLEAEIENIKMAAS
ncbi:pre-mRNA-splicing factor SPF27-like [Xenia sp. Carnegie-2017]|uniref:pre-mRNA-splicing factor SPF27-like n=1 Tax=Xenia sp. Carnegie-2017 TaxID=2897299 RepID=UPI001F03F595|nr:pre-mRNA-splicing factor SPF27-like [Xenia sp. Carnegie-2017]